MGYGQPDASAVEGDGTLPCPVPECDDTVLPSDTAAHIEAHIAEDKRKARVAEAAEFELDKLKAKDMAYRQRDEQEARSLTPTWVQVDHDVAFGMSKHRLLPDIGRMTETPNSPPLPLFYSGKINGVHGDSEAGKSWLMQYVSVQELGAGRHVLYVDFEDDAGGVYRRLQSLGATEESIRRYFHYVNPQNKLTVFEQIEYAKLISMDAPHSLAVIDGVTEAMSLESLTGRDEGEVAKWHNTVTKPLAAYGWGVGMIDHTPHGETRVIGSQHKRSAITGVSYSLDSLASFAPGQCGRSVLRVEKDRPGWIRGESAPGARPQWYGTFVLDATVGSILQPSVWPWKPESAEDAKGYEKTPPHVILRRVWEFVDLNPGASTRAIRTAVKGAKLDTILTALEWLVAHDHITESKGSNRSTLHHAATEYASDDLQVVPAGGSQDPEPPGTSFDQGSLT